MTDQDFYRLRPIAAKTAANYVILAIFEGYRGVYTTKTMEQMQCTMEKVRGGRFFQPFSKTYGVGGTKRREGKGGEAQRREDLAPRS